MLGASADVELAMAELLSPFVPAPIRSDFLLAFSRLEPRLYVVGKAFGSSEGAGQSQLSPPQP
jgi:hypothetical protein